VTFKTQKRILHFSQIAVINPLIAYLESRGVVTAKYLLHAGLVPGWLENGSNPVPKSIVIDSINIAGSLGYSNPANFSRAFRRLTGRSPSAYQTQYKLPS
jgi:AraC-like DNA-binding protein